MEKFQQKLEQKLFGKTTPTLSNYSTPKPEQAKPGNSSSPHQIIVPPMLDNNQFTYIQMLTKMFPDHVLFDPALNKAVTMADLQTRVLDLPGAPVSPDRRSKRTVPYQPFLALSSTSLNSIGSVASTAPLLGSMASAGAASLGAIAMPVVGIVQGLIGTFMGIYTAVELNRLGNEIKNLNRQTNILFQVTNQHEVKLKQLAEDLVKLTTFTEALLENNPTVFFARLNRQISLLEDRMGQALDVVQQLQNHRLAVNLLSGQQLRDMHLHFQTLAAQNDLVLLPTEISHYFQVETSYIRQGNDVTILVHVPCVHPDHILKLYRYIPYPFPLSFHSFIHPHSIRHAVSNGSFFLDDIAADDLINHNDSVPEGLVIVPDGDFLAVGQDHSYQLLTAAELGLCDRRSRVTLCREHQVLKLNLEDSCLGSLFLRSEDGARIRCRFTRQRLEEQVYQLSPTDHLIYSPKPLTTEVRCRNGSHYPMFVSENNNRLHIPAGCSAKLRKHDLRSDYDIQLDPEPLTSVWNWNPEMVSFTALEDVDRADRQLMTLHQDLAILQNFTVNNRTFDDHLDASLEDPGRYPWFWWLLIAFVLSSLVLIGLCACWYGTRYCGGCQRFLELCSGSPDSLDQGLPRGPVVVYNAKTAQLRCQHGLDYGLCCSRRM